MKKLLLTFLTTLVVGFGLHAQNPTIVRPINGIENATAATTGVVQPRLRTNNQNNAVQQVYGHDASGLFRWYDASTFGGIPTNFTWTIDLLTNTIAGGDWTIATPGDFTNRVGTFTLLSGTSGTGAINLGGNVSFNDLLRDSNGWGIGSTRQNAGFAFGASLALRQSIQNTSGTISSADNGIMQYVDATSGPLTFTLPTASSNPNKIFCFQKYDTSTNTVTFVGTGLDTNVVLMAKGDSAIFHCDNASNQWRMVSSQQYPMSWQGNPLSAKVLVGNAFSYNVNALFWHQIFIYQDTPANTNTIRLGYVNLARGVFTMRMVGNKDGNCGIQDLYWGTNKVGSIDWYNAVAARNQIVDTTFTNLIQGRYELKSVINGKNASSSDFYLQLIDYSIFP